MIRKPAMWPRKKHLVVPVVTGRGGIKNEVYVSEFRHFDQPIHSFVGGSQPSAHGGAQGPIGLPASMPTMCAHGALLLAVTQNLDHQIGADIA